MFAGGRAKIIVTPLRVSYSCDAQRAADLPLGSQRAGDMKVATAPPQHGDQQRGQCRVYSRRRRFLNRTTYTYSLINCHQNKRTASYYLVNLSR